MTARAETEGSTAAPPVRHARGRRTSPRRAVLWSIAGLLVLALGALGWTAVDLWRIKGELTDAGDQIGTLQRQVTDRDAVEAAWTLTTLQEHTGRAHQLSSGVHWRLATAVPWIGDDLAAVRTLAEVADDLSRNGLPSLLTAVEVVDPSDLLLPDGRVDLEPLTGVADQVVDGDAAVRSALDRIEALDTDALLPQLAQPVHQVHDQLAGVAATTATAARAVQLLPAMLGADGPRDYLLLVQNNAEQRAAGGIPGVVLLLRAEDGTVQILDQRSGASVASDEPVLPLTEAEEVLFGTELATDLRNVTSTPDFPRTGELAAELWQRDTGQQVDGVLAVDPVVVAALVGVTGPVTLADGTVLHAEDTVEQLLSTVYQRFDDPAAQDAHFATAAAGVLDAVTGGTADPAGLVSALADAAGQGRVLVWSGHQSEQELLTGTVLSGAIADADQIGIYLNDGTQAKLGYYLDTEVTLDPDCAAGEVAVTVRLTSTVPADAADSLPAYVLGGDGPADPGVLQTNVLIYAPAGSGLSGMQRDGAQAGGVTTLHDGRSVFATTVTLAPGDSTELTLTVATDPDRAPATDLRVTPGATAATVHTTRPACSP